MAEAKNMEKLKGAEFALFRKKFGNIEALKESYGGTGCCGKFDIFKDKTTGYIFVALKDPKGREITQYYVCDVRSL